MTLRQLKKVSLFDELVIIKEFPSKPLYDGIFIDVPVEILDRPIMLVFPRNYELVIIIGKTLDVEEV